MQKLWLALTVGFALSAATPVVFANETDGKRPMTERLRERFSHGGSDSRAQDPKALHPRVIDHVVVRASESVGAGVVDAIFGAGDETLRHVGHVTAEGVVDELNTPAARETMHQLAYAAGRGAVDGAIDEASEHVRNLGRAVHGRVQRGTRDVAGAATGAGAEVLAHATHTADEVHGAVREGLGAALHGSPRGVLRAHGRLMRASLRGARGMTAAALSGGHDVARASLRAGRR